MALGENSSPALFSTTRYCYFSYWTDHAAFERKWSNWKYVTFRLEQNGDIVYQRVRQLQRPQHKLNQCFISPNEPPKDNHIHLRQISNTMLKKVPVAAQFNEVAIQIDGVLNYTDHVGRKREKYVAYRFIMHASELEQFYLALKRVYPEIEDKQFTDGMNWEVIRGAVQSQSGEELHHVRVKVVSAEMEAKSLQELHREFPRN